MMENHCRNRVRIEQTDLRQKMVNMAGSEENVILL